MKNNGTTDPEEIATAQDSGVVLTKEDFKKSINYQQVVELLKSIKELTS